MFAVLNLDMHLHECTVLARHYWAACIESRYENTRTWRFAFTSGIFGFGPDFTMFVRFRTMWHHCLYPTQDGAAQHGPMFGFGASDYSVQRPSHRQPSCPKVVPCQQNPSYCRLDGAV